MKKKLSLFPVRYRNIPLLFMFFFSLLFLEGCFYYKINTKKGVTSEDLRWAAFNKKFLILHFGDSVWNLQNLEIGEKGFSGSLYRVPASRLTRTSKDGSLSYTYKKSREEITLDQVHLFVTEPFVTGIKQGDSISIGYSEVFRIESFAKDKGRTNTVWIGSFVGAVVVIAGVAAIVIAATSCPYVYVKTNHGFTFTGEIFGGAVYSSLERHDYLPLPDIEPSGNQYTLKIANELAETQHINLAELWIVNHPENLTVLPDRHGAIHSVKTPELPQKALSIGNIDLLPMVSVKDHNSCLFDEQPSLTRDTNAFNSAIMTFAVPEQADTGKLVIRAGNSLWADFTYSEFTKLFGNKYDWWINRQGKVPAEKNIQWGMDQRFMMMVYLETNTGWQFVDYFDNTGPQSERDMIMSIPLKNALVSNNPAGDPAIRIKIESGFKFWELDYAAMDFSKNFPVEIIQVKPVTATTESGKDIRQIITENDNKYYVQQRTGEEGLIVFPCSKDTPGMKKSVFLHAKGYYEHVRDYPGPPDKKLLETFAIPGRLSQFSFTAYQEFIKTNAVLISEPDHR